MKKMTSKIYMAAKSIASLYAIARFQVKRQAIQGRDVFNKR